MAKELLTIGEKQLPIDELIDALLVCAAGDGEACLTCPYGKIPGDDPCGELLKDAAEAMKVLKGL